MSTIRQRYLYIPASIILGCALGITQSYLTADDDCTAITGDCTWACAPWENVPTNPKATALVPSGADVGGNIPPTGTKPTHYYSSERCGVWYNGHNYDCPDRSSSGAPKLGDLCPDDPQ